MDPIQHLYDSSAFVYYVRLKGNWKAIAKEIGGTVAEAKAGLKRFEDYMGPLFAADRTLTPHGQTVFEGLDKRLSDFQLGLQLTVMANRSGQKISSKAN